MIELMSVIIWGVYALTNIIIYLYIIAVYSKHEWKFEDLQSEECYQGTKVAKAMQAFEIATWSFFIVTEIILIIILLKIMKNYLDYFYNTNRINLIILACTNIYFFSYGILWLWISYYKNGNVFLIYANNENICKKSWTATMI